MAKGNWIITVIIRIVIIIIIVIRIIITTLLLAVAALLRSIAYPTSAYGILIAISFSAAISAFEKGGQRQPALPRLSAVRKEGAF